MPGQQMQCGISTVHRLFATRRLQQNNLMQSQQAVKEDTRLPSPVKQWQPHTHTHTHRSVTSPRRGTQRWSSTPVWAAIHDRRHVLQVGPVLNEHPDPRTGSPSTRGRQQHQTPGQKTEVAWRSIPPRTRNILTILQMEAMFLTVI